MNGAMGTVVAICYRTGQAPPNLPIAVTVHFDSYTGPTLAAPHQPLCTRLHIHRIRAHACPHNALHSPVIGLAVSNETRQCWVLLMLYKVPYSATLGANTRCNPLCWGDSEMETARFCHILLHSTFGYNK